MKYKMDHIWGNSETNTVDITALENKVNAVEAKTTALETKATAIETKANNNETNITNTRNTLNNLSTIAAKTNIANTFTANQTINGFIINSNGYYKDANFQSVSTLKLQGEKTMSFDFIQQTAGFRNYCNIALRHKYGNQTDAQYTTLFKLTTKNTNEGIDIAVEADKINFPTKTVISNAVLKELKELVAASTDFNDFKNRIAGW